MTIRTPPERYTRIAAYMLCHDEQGRVLLCRIASGDLDAGSWTLPGGGLEFGEEPESGALRELEEETGLRGEIDGIVGVDSVHLGADETLSGREVHALRIVYRGRVVGGDLRDEIEGSTDHAEWLSREELAAAALVALVTFALDRA